MGKRDVALLRVLGDCGLRSAELRGLLSGDVRRPRSNAKHFRLFIRGKGGVEREVDVPADTQAAIEAWMAVHRSHAVAACATTNRSSCASAATAAPSSPSRSVVRAPPFPT